MLDEIIKAKRKRVATQKKKLPLQVIKERVSLKKDTRNFRQALLGQDLSIIAEIKKASPSRGDIAPNMNIEEMAGIYEESNASAISVLTEEDYFKGESDHIDIVKKRSSLPVLRKDFIFEDYQVYESRYLGADAVLLIAAIIDESKLGGMVEMVYKLNMEPLVEVHSKEEIRRALKTKAKVIGINNRDLKTFNINLNTTVELIPLIGKDRIVISESGIRSKEDADRLKKIGVDAILVGESIVESSNIKEKINSLIN